MFASALSAARTVAQPAVVPAAAQRRSTSASASAAPPASQAGLFAASVFTFSAQEAFAYGGTANLIRTDSGTGNPRYDDLIAANKAQGIPKLDIEAYKKATGRAEDKSGGSRPICLTGREKACQ